MKTVITCAVLFFVACTKHEEQSTSAMTLPQSASSVAASDAGPITACTVTFTCGLSHPGLGSGERTTSVDLGKCERASWSESGPYDPTSPRNPPEKTITKVAQAECDRLRALAASLGPADAREAQESAHIDMEACGLTITCSGETNARFDVQRQTTTGRTRVEQTIRAVLGAP